jgi:uncharacterized protein YbjT (DUF2867 family)
MSQKIENAVALVTGANRGIGREFVAELLRRGAKKIYLGARDPASLADLIALDPTRLVPLKLDVTNAADVADAAKIATDVTLLINNAGFAGGQGVISAPDLSIARQEMEVNYFGVLSLEGIRADPCQGFSKQHRQCAVLPVAGDAAVGRDLFGLEGCRSCRQPLHSGGIAQPGYAGRRHHAGTGRDRHGPQPAGTAPAAAGGRQRNARCGRGWRRGGFPG